MRNTNGNLNWEKLKSKLEILRKRGERQRDADQRIGHQETQRNAEEPTTSTDRHPLNIHTQGNRVITHRREEQLILIYTMTGEHRLNTMTTDTDLQNRTGNPEHEPSK